METIGSYGSSSPPFWREVWIVAGGPSARAFDLSRLNGKPVISVNGHFSSDWGVSPSAVALFSLDNRWVRSNRRILSSHEGEKYVALPLETWPDCDGIPGVTYLRWSHDDGLSEDSGVINCGCNGAYGALGLAYHKRAEEVHFVGLDLDPADDEEYAYWAPLFRSTLPQLAKRGVRVINHNVNSFVDAFERAA